MSKVNLWYMYDFANSFASSVIIFYFPLILSQGGASDTWIGVSTAISTAVLLIFYPALGRKADTSQNKRMSYIKISSVFMVLALLFIGLITNSSIGEYTLGVLFVLSALYIIFQIAFQGSYVFYSSFMQDFENDGHDKSKISSFGMGLGQLGNAISVGLVGVLIVGGTFTLFGFSGKSLTMITGAIIFIVLGLPFLLQKLSDRKPVISDAEQYKVFSIKDFLDKVFINKKILYYLIGYTLVADSTSTLQVYMTLYLKNVFDFTEKASSIAGAISLLCLFITCMILGRFASNIVNKNRALIIGGSIYIFAYIMLGLAPNIAILGYISIALVGIAYGLFFPLARSLYSDLVPKDQQAEYFSSFVIFERAATIVGPLMWITVSLILSRESVEYVYRFNVLVLAVIAITGLLLIRKSFKVIA